MKLNIVTAVLLLGVGIYFGIHSGDQGWNLHRSAGAAVAMISLVLLLVARYQLGRAFSVRAKASELVTTGLYSRIRNPIYVFSSLTLLGLLIYAGRPWWLLFFAVLIPLQVVRGRKEARVLEEKFGPAYLEYKRSTWF